MISSARVNVINAHLHSTAESMPSDTKFTRASSQLHSITWYQELDHDCRMKKSIGDLIADKVADITLRQDQDSLGREEV
eukprot:5831594-Ditylum_brightwellii.AAC.1